MPKNLLRLGETFSVKAPAEKVRSFLDDAPAVAACMPGLEALAVVDRTTFEATIVRRAKGVTARLKLRIHIEDESPTRLAGSATGNEVKTGTSYDASGSVNIRPLGPDVAEVTFAAECRLEGILAARGFAWAIDISAKEVTKEFAAELARRVEAGPAT